MRAIQLVAQVGSRLAHIARGLTKDGAEDDGPDPAAGDPRESGEQISQAGLDHSGPGAIVWATS